MKSGDRVKGSYCTNFGWTPVIVRRDIEVLRMFNQLVSLPMTRLPRKMLEFDIVNKGMWSSNMMCLLKSLDLLHSWETRECVNLDSAKDKLLQMYQEIWMHQIHMKPKLRTYVQFKD